MKTKEFIKRVEELGYPLSSSYYCWEIRNKKNYLIAVVSKDVLYKISTDSAYWDVIPDEDKNKLLELIVEFASTPVMDREEEKKFLIQHKYLVSKAICQVNLAKNKEKNVYRLINCKVDNLVYQVQFTLNEIEEIKEKFDTDLSDFELVEVEE